MVAGFSLVSPDDLAAVSCIIGFRDDGALSSHFMAGTVIRLTVLVSSKSMASSTVESAFSNLGIDVAVVDRLSIGTKADFTTSMGSSSESSDEWSCIEFISSDEFIFIDILCWDGGLDDDGRDEAGDRRDAAFRCSLAD